MIRPWVWGVVFLAAVAPGRVGFAWQTWSGGLDYGQWEKARGAEGETFACVALRADPKAVDIRVIDARRCCGGPATAREMALSTGALAVINGGFFDDKPDPLGLVIADGVETNRLREVSWFGVFFVEHGKPRIRVTRDFARSHERGKGGVLQAIQAGPRLLVKGKVPSGLKRQVSARSVVGIDKAGRVLLVCTRDSAVSAEGLGRFLATTDRRGGPECQYVLNLDGGGSTQLYVRSGDNEIDLPGRTRVLNGIGLFAKRR